MAKRNRVDYSKLHGDKIKKSFEKKSYDPPNLLKFDSSAEKHIIEVRFLPLDDDDALPFLMLREHKAYLGKTNFFFSTCNKTYGDDCPICNINYSKIDKNTVKEKRLYPSQTFLANVLVVKDSVNPDNEGKIMMFQYAKTIHNYLKELLIGDAETDEDPIFYYDLNEGCNIRIVKKGTKIATEYKPKALKISAVSEDLDSDIEKDVVDVEKYAKEYFPAKSVDEMIKNYTKFVTDNDFLETD